MTTPEKKYTNPLTDIDKVIKGFKNPKIIEKYPNIHNLELLKDQILWVLWVIEEKFSTVGYVPPEWISEILIEGLKISAPPDKVKKALATVKGLAHPRKIQGQLFYKIMQKGITRVEVTSGKDQTPVYRIGGTTPRKDKQYLIDIIKTSKGEIKIVDPFYGINSLTMLESLDFGKPIKLLTAKFGDGKKEVKFSHELKDFKKEHKKIEIRVYQNPSELHDRYIITKKSVIFLGHGIKDIGGKESFILVFEGKSGKTIISDLEKNFDDRWNNSTSI